ncbi:MAG: zinc ribbon domain-containing protein [Candidatus Thorarchaeota archaeon]
MVSNQPAVYSVKNFKQKMIDTSRRLAYLHTFYLMIIFVAIGSLFISFAYFALYSWYDYNDPIPRFFEYDLFPGLGITMAVLAVPGLLGMAFRVILLFNLSTHFDDMKHAYPFLKPKVEKLKGFLLLGPVGEIVAVFIVPLVGNLVGAVITLYSYNLIKEIFNDLKMNNLYEGEVRNDLFYSYLSLIVIFPAISITSLILIWLTNLNILHFILIGITLLVLIVSLVWHSIAFFKFSNDTKLLKEPPPVIYPQEQYAAYQPTAQPQPQPTGDFVPAKKVLDSEVTEPKFCVNCGFKLDTKMRFCPECGANIK